MASKPRCYIASPLGFTEAGRQYYNNVLLPALSDYVEPIDPWALVTDEQINEAAASGQERQLAAEIGEMNLNALRESEMLIAVLDGQEVDSGTAAEVGFAAALGLPCFGLRTDHRKAGEPGATINLQVEAFITLNGGKMTASTSDLRKSVLTYLRTITERVEDHEESSQPLPHARSLAS